MNGKRNRGRCRISYEEESPVLEGGTQLGSLVGGAGGQTAEIDDRDGVVAGDGGGGTVMVGDHVAARQLVSAGRS
jgi:hypothetical protein